MKTFLCVVILVLGLPARGFSADAFFEEWKEYVQDKHLGAILASVGKGDIRHWPAIYSSACDPELSLYDRQMQAAFRKTSANLLIDLRKLSSQERANVSEAISTSSLLLKWRALLYESPSYHNLLMAEAVNRVLVVRLIDSILLRNAYYRVATSNLVKVAREDLFPTESWRIVLDQELRKKSFGQSVVRTHNSSESIAITCRALWAEMGRSDNIVLPTNAHRITLYDLQEHPDMALLLHRYIKTDGLMRLVEMIQEYMWNASSASARDGVEEIAREFPMDSHSHTTLTPLGAKTEHVALKPNSKWSVEEVVSGEPFSALQVAGLLGAFARGQSDAIMIFSLTAAQ